MRITSADIKEPNRNGVPASHRRALKLTMKSLDIAFKV
jgi:hypothetical protein